MRYGAAPGPLFVFTAGDVSVVSDAFDDALALSDGVTWTGFTISGVAPSPDEVSGSLDCFASMTGATFAAAVPSDATRAPAFFAACASVGSDTLTGRLRAPW